MPSPSNKPPMGPPRGPGHGPGAPREKPKNMKKTLGLLIRYIAGSKGLITALLVTMLFVTLLNMAAPSLQAGAIDTITIGEGRLHIDGQGLARALVLLGATYLLSSLFTYAQGLLAAQLSQTTVRNLRADLFQKIEYLPVRYTDTHQHGDIMSRMTNDVENISNTVSQSIASLFSGVLTIVGTVAIMLYYSPLLTLVSMSSIALTLCCTAFLSKFMRRYFPEQQRLLGLLNGHVEEMVTGYRTVVAFGREEQAKEQFNQLSGQLRRCGVKAQIFGGSMGPLMNVVQNLGFLLIAACGGWLALSGAITVGTIQAFILYSKQFTRPINELANQYAAIQTAIAGAERVFEIMYADPEPDEGKKQLRLQNVQGNLDFNRVDFSYIPGEQVLKGLDLHVRSGQKIAIVGATGSGKTTIVNLLTRFYDIDGGSILLDGEDIRHYPLEQLRKSIAIVLQDTIIFSDTVDYNIRFGRLNATRQEVEQAARTARAHSFIQQLPQGYDTHLSENGGNLSQGQRQLLSIARAVLADPKILILDEATSSIDTRTEVHIQEAMINLMKGRTSLIIAHRLSTIRDADRIVVIDGGRVAESGSHEELLAKKGSYYRLYQSQFAGMET